MNRREFVRNTLAATVAAGVAAEARACEPAPATKPNILYVFSDQHRAVSLPGEEYNQALAPSLDAFRRQNVSMDACISNYPLCSPHRSILMSGRYPAETGVDRNGPALPLDTLGLGEALRRAGYHTGYIGKWHLAGGAEKGFIPKGAGRFGFEDWHVWDNTNLHYHSWTYDPDSGARINPVGYQPTRMTDQAVTFLKQQKPGQPWFLILSWNPPHPPFDPPDEDKKPYPPESIKSRPNVRVAPPGVHLGATRQPLNSLQTLHEAQQGYYGGITAIDKEFARLLKALDENGQTANTVVIYTSDHGEMMGSHGHMAKQMPHEESNRVPFFVRTPGNTKPRSSKVLFSTIDIYPSVCGLAGVPVPPHCRGRDLSAALRGEDTPSPDHVFLMNELKPNSPEQFTPSYRGIRTSTHTYAVTDGGRWLLYDNIADPYQMKNLVKDPSQATLIAQFDTAIAGWIAMTRDKFPYQKALKSYAPYTDDPLPDGHNTGPVEPE